MSPGRSVREYFLLALPMVVTRCGLATMGIADAFMVARYDAREFAWLSLAEGTLGRFLDVGIAFLVGALSLVPRHAARGDRAGAFALWTRTTPFALAFGLAALAVAPFGREILAGLGQSAELAAGAAPVMTILAAGYAPALLAMAAGLYLEGTRQPHWVAIGIVVANVLNVVLNWLLIGGLPGMPALGARGAALSTTVVRVTLALVLVEFARRSRHARTAAPSPGAAEERRAELARSRASQWTLGGSASATTASMVILTGSLTVFAGWLGTLALGTYSATWNVVMPIVLLALGLSDAAGIEVAAAAGRSGEADAAATARTCLRRALPPTAVLAVAVGSSAPWVARLFTGDAALAGAMAAILPLACTLVVVDAAGFVMAASLRAVREAAWLSGIEIGSMLLMVPLAAWLALRNGYGVGGLFAAMLAVAIARAGALAARFFWRTGASGRGAASTTNTE
jgi:multidrug resistance protein, MATE family